MSESLLEQAQTLRELMSAREESRGIYGQYEDTVDLNDMIKKQKELIGRLQNKAFDDNDLPRVSE